MGSQRREDNEEIEDTYDVSSAIQNPPLHSDYTFVHLVKTSIQGKGVVCLHRDDGTANCSLLYNSKKKHKSTGRRTRPVE